MMSKKYNKKIVEKAAVQLAALKAACTEILCDSELNKEFGKTALSGLKTAINKIDNVRNRLEEKTGERIFFSDVVQGARASGEAFPDEAWIFFDMERESD